MRIGTLCAMQHSAESARKSLAWILHTALAHESVDPGVLFDEKPRGRKSRETVPLRFVQFLPHKYRVLVKSRQPQVST
jgi:hypothetical protein